MLFGVVNLIDGAISILKSEFEKALLALPARKPKNPGKVRVKNS